MKEQNYELVPGRIFLDSSVLQTLLTYGEYIYDGGEIAIDDRIRSVPQGLDNVIALSALMSISNRGAFEFAISRNTLSEVDAKQDFSYWDWAIQMMIYWETQLSFYNYLKDNSEMTAKIDRKSFNYLSKADRLLIKDALYFDCNIFLTMEKRLPKNSSHIERNLDIKVLTPVKLWQLLQNYSFLF